MGVDLRMVGKKFKRKETLKDHLTMFNVNEEGVVYFHTPNNDKYPFPDAPHSVCGFWYKNARKCKQSSPCIFVLNGRTKMGAITGFHDTCPISDQKVRGNILTEKNVKKIFPPKEEHYNSRW
jgi:hypothetical protein